MKQLLNMYDTFVGQVVVLRSGGPPMTVSASRSENNSVAVVWSVDGAVFEYEFPILCLNYNPGVVDEA